MQADKDEAEILRRALQAWKQEGLLTEEQTDQLDASIKPKENQSQQLAQYLLIIALSCALLGVCALLIDEKLLERLRRNFLISYYSIAGLAGILATVCFIYTVRKRKRLTELTFELNVLVGAILTLIAITYFCKIWGNGQAYTGFAAITTIVFFSLAVWLRARVLWLSFLAASMAWFGAFSGIHQKDGLFLGMNYPVRFTLFGAIVILLGLLQEKWDRLQSLKDFSQQLGLIIFYCGVCGVAVFGNIGMLDVWQRIRQTTMLPYAIGCGLLTGFLLILGIRKNKNQLRDFSLLFLLLQLYIHYFSYFWDSMNKGVFFLFLALSLGLLARWLRHSAERKERKVAKKTNTGSLSDSAGTR